MLFFKYIGIRISQYHLDCFLITVESVITSLFSFLVLVNCALTSSWTFVWRVVILYSPQNQILGLSIPSYMICYLYYSFFLLIISFCNSPVNFSVAFLSELPELEHSNKNPMVPSNISFSKARGGTQTFMIPLQGLCLFKKSTENVV